MPAVIELSQYRPAAASRTRAVYAQPRSHVKWSFARAFGPCALAAAVLAGGCTPLQTPMHQQGPSQRTRPPVGMWYSVELAASTPAGLAETLARDFSNFQTMGVDTVLVRHCDPRDAEALCKAAGAHRLRLIIADPVAMRYLRTGWPGSRAFAPPALVPQRQPIEARYVGWVVDEVSLERAGQLARLAQSAKPPIPIAVEVDAALAHRLPADAIAYVLPRSRSATARSAPPTASPSASVVERPSRRTLRTVECVRGGDDGHAVRSWLAGFHLGLTEEPSAGVVFDTYRALPAGTRGVVLAGESLPPEHLVIIRRIAERCRRWHELLDGMQVHNTRTAPVRDAEVRIALLTNDSRQCLLIVNPSSDRFARGQLTIHTAMAAAAFDRAVSVATAERTMAGPVHRVVNNRVDIPLALAPGEADLFELF